MLPFKMDSGHCLVASFYGLFEVLTEACYSKDPPSPGDELVVDHVRSGVKDVGRFRDFNPLVFVESFDWLARFIVVRITT